MGRGIYVVDAITGALVWSAGKFAGATTTVAEMHFAIPADVSVVKNESGGPTNRAYAVDTGGNVWRIDFKPSAVGANDLNATTVTKLAALGDLSTPAARRKFQYGPDVVKTNGYDAVLVGAGDREHPFDTSVVNRMYMIKDKGNDTGPLTGTDPVTAPTVIESAMFDATSNCIQDVAVCDSTQAAAATTALGAASGWYITLGNGEKIVGNAISLGGTTFFNTNQPDAGAGGGTCGANLGIARAYQVSTFDATATNDLNVSGTLTTSDRSQTIAGGGYLPSPVHVVVMLDGTPVEAVVSGVQVSQPPGVAIASRLRKFWYKEVDR
jgi:type IV pilus assembly protein PilY1